VFERYSEKARRVIFFARYEASVFHSQTIETEHLLLGFLRENEGLAHRFFYKTSPEAARRQIELRARRGQEEVATTVDLPLSPECSRVLAFAAQEADFLRHDHVGVAHLLLGMLREEQCLAAVILGECGVTLEEARSSIATEPPQERRGPVTFPARDGHFDPASARKLQLALMDYFAARQTEWNITASVDQPVEVGPGRSHIADFCIRAGRVTELIARTPPFVCAEIVGKHTTLREAMERMDEYLAMGVQYVWLIDPTARRLYVSTAEGGLRQWHEGVLRTENPSLEVPIIEMLHLE